MSASSETTVTSVSSLGNDVAVDHEKEERRYGCLGGNRYIVLVIALFFLSFMLSSIICYNASYVSMVNLHSSPYWDDFIKSNKSIDEINWNDPDLPLSQRRFAFDTAQKSLGFAAGFLGAIAAVVPMSRLTARFGCHKVMTLSGIFGTVLVFISPVVVSWSFPVFLVLRVLQGITLANLFTTAGVVVNEWAAMNEKGLFISVLSAHVEMGAVFTMPVSGALATSAGWPWVFYLHGAILGALTILWAVYYRDRAVKHPFVQRKEWRKISFGKRLNQVGKGANDTPIRKIVSSIVIWGVWIAVIGNFLVSQFSISYAPIYLRGVIGCTPTEAGLLTLIPMACLLVIKFSTGFFSDRIKSISDLTKMKMFNSCALLGSSIFFIILACSSPGRNKVLDVILLSIPMALLGFSSGGYSKCAVMVSGQYSPFVMSIVQIIACSSLMAGSFLVPALTPTDSFSEWQRVFMVYGAVLAITNTIFIVFARAEPAKWAQQKGDLTLAEAVMGCEQKPVETVSDPESGLPRGI
ncbi:hypothetical protein GCK72_004806 [Caenorhabditis remanei]|uniref:Major facilitator superfamily (MFS) profile domain-containing protein n=1 Tax=Caenorhabditis remanei TaxID=31234 RepID=A0A6A5HDF6_CAERE|nr:hypothetical protein GCK72_004806 [Caenorhabditis remanei]KAF1764856.1 hypothetical protein GCK72_004806 [Caenorhabditis remanei]